MGIETERRFLVRNDDWKKSFYYSVEITQAYLSTDIENVVRVRTVTRSACRHVEDHAFLTIKGKQHGSQRQESEFSIPLSAAQALIIDAMRRGEKPIKKCRAYLSGEFARWVVDAFYEDNEGLMIAEREFGENDVDPNKLVIPDWIGEEVTQDFKYSNVALYRHPYKRW